MHRSISRRSVLLAAGAIPFTGCAALLSGAPHLDGANRQLAALESATGGRLGVSALDTGSGVHLAYRAEERFPFCSTFKLMLAAMVLARSSQEPGLLQRRIRFTQADMVAHAPITGTRIADGMTMEELCDATVRYSDNPAANLLMKALGGPAAVTAFARSIGDEAFRLDRWETALNSAIPGDPRDTTTPWAMTRSVHKLALGDALPASARAMLVDWLRRNTTGDTRIRAGVPAGWVVGDKTGTGVHGTTNDIGVVWPAGRAPMVVSLYYTHRDEKSPARNDVLASATRIVVAALR